MMLNPVPLLLGVLMVSFASMLAMKFDMGRLGSSDRFLRSQKPECPTDPIEKRVKPHRINLTNGGCRKSFFGDSCHGAKISCCTNVYGDDICIRVRAFMKMQRRKNNKEKSIPPRNRWDFPHFFDAGVTPTNNCPKSNVTIDSEGNTVLECVDYFPPPECSPTGECSPGRICCEDPCFMTSEDEKTLRFCYPDPEFEEPTPPGMALAIVAGPNALECPTVDEICARNPDGCNSEFRRRCPIYDEGSIPCATNDNCGTSEGSKRVCCPDFCEGSESSLCMLHAGFVGVPPVVDDMQDDAPIALPAMPGAQCPAVEPLSCVTITTGGDIEDCTESETCSDQTKLCCKLSDCGPTDISMYCVDPVVGEQLPEGCPVPYRIVPFNIEDEDCVPESCIGDTICCPLSQHGGSFCFTFPM